MARARSVPRGSIAASPALWRRFPEGAQRLLTVFVLHPETIPAKWLVELAANPTSLDVLAQRQLIVEESNGGWGLAPGLDREVWKRLAAWSLRQDAHRRLAELCQRGPAIAKLAAGHWEAVGERAAAMEAWLQEARTAVRKREVGAAIEAVEEVLRLSRGASLDAEVLSAGKILAECATWSGAAEQLIPRLERWFQDEDGDGNPSFVATIGPLLAGLLAGSARHAEGAEVRLRTAGLLRRARNFRGAAQEAVAAATTLTFGYHFTAARRAFDEAIAAAKAAGDAALLAQAWIGSGLLFGMRGDAVAGRALLEKALDIALPLGLTGLAAEAYRVLGSVAEYSSCYGDEQVAFSRALAYCRRHDATTTADICLGCLSYSLFRSGNWKRSREVAESVLARRNVPEVSRCVAEGVLGLLHAHRGERRDAVARLESSNTRALQTGILGMQFFNFWGLALVEEQAGRPVDAALHYRRLLECWQGTEDRHDAIPGLTAGVIFFARRDDREALDVFSAALQKIAREVANPEAHAAAALARAERERLEGRAKEAVRGVQEALADYGRGELVVERVRGLICLGTAQCEQGDLRSAQAAWKEARQRAKRLGARPFADQAEAELKKMASVKPKAEMRNGAGKAPSGLSARQWEVVEQVCAGLTNKEIANRLGLSVRTVDMHVSHVLIRLNCRSRTEVATRVQASRLKDPPIQ